MREYRKVKRVFDTFLDKMKQVSNLSCVIHFIDTFLCYRKMLWKRLNTESDPKKNRNLPKINFFEAFPVFSKIIGNPSNLIFRGISRFLSVSPIFRSDSGLYGSYIFEGFPNIFEGFPNIFNPFPLFLGPFLVFKKNCKFSVC